MDSFVPSISTINNHLATSPQYLSIYDQDRSDLYTSFCGESHPFKYTTEATSVEEFSNLDDKIEDSNLKTMFTPELINTFSATTSSGLSSAQWQGKANATEFECNTNLTLNEINIDGSDITFMDIFNCDTNDSKLSFPPLDLLTSDIKSSDSSSCHTPVPLMCVEPSIVASSPGSLPEQGSKDFLCGEELIPSNPVADPKNSMTDMGMSYLYRKNAPPMKVNFPPREAQPPLIGIVTPVKKPELPETPISEELKPDILELKPHPYNLKNSHDELKNSKSLKTVATVAYSFHDMPPQTVPSCKSLKRGYDEVKREPESPPSKKLCMNDNILEDAKNVLPYNKEDHVQSQRTRCDSGGSGHISDGADDDYMKDVYDSDDDDYSDIDADISLSPSGSESLIDTGKKQKQFFWQYNVQAKGPKGTRLKLAVDAPKDPHVLNDFEDPVFDECNTVVAGIRHGGKARKGDGNEITPNPKKLVLIGRQLLKLNKEINACQLGSDVPVSKRNESRKEKNKLASRACRLKKKAQHEANKIKLHGLEEEHTQINNVVQHIWPHLRDRVKILLKHEKLDSGSGDTPSLTSSLNAAISSHLKNNVAKATTEYVNSVILKAEAGVAKGGLNIPSRKS